MNEVIFSDRSFFRTREVFNKGRRPQISVSKQRKPRYFFGTHFPRISPPPALELKQDTPRIKAMGRISPLQRKNQVRRAIPPPPIFAAQRKGKMHSRGAENIFFPQDIPFSKQLGATVAQGV